MIGRKLEHLFPSGRKERQEGPRLQTRGKQGTESGDRDTSTPESHDTMDPRLFPEASREEHTPRLSTGHACQRTIPDSTPSGWRGWWGMGEERLGAAGKRVAYGGLGWEGTGWRTGPTQESEVTRGMEQGQLVRLETM